MVTVSTASDLEGLEAKLLDAAKRSSDAVQTIIEAQTPLGLLHAFKFDPVGHHPMTGSKLNLIEQVNQTFTHLVTYRAVRSLLDRHPEVDEWHLNLGTTAGTDIASVDKSVAAEVFAAVTPANNNKLLKDVRRVDATAASHKYVFFHSPGYSGKQDAKKGHEDVIIIAVDVVL